MSQFDALSNQQLETLQADTRTLIDDGELSVEVTYKHYGGLTSIDLESGAPTESESTDTVNAIRRIVTEERAARSGGTLQTGDRMYLIDKGDLSSAPHDEELITEGSTDYKIVRWGADQLNHFWLITARER